ncbi:MAG: S-methyl-5-thioribose-1-phosphate isomerase [Methylophilaceae bacterium]
MYINKKHYRAIWPDPRCQYVEVIDQTQLPFSVEISRIYSLDMMVHAIKTMQVRGAPLIGVAAAYGLALAMREDDSDTSLEFATDQLIKTRPTAVNLAWAVNHVSSVLQSKIPAHRNIAAWRQAGQMAEADVQRNQSIGQHGLAIIQKAHKGGVFNVLTHCNAGWLATVDFGTALSPIYAAHDAGLNIHVWVDETRPRNQGASLTAWELAQHGVPHTIITDNTGGHLMQQGLVNMVIVGADRVTANGDVCNKIGTYLKALAAYDCNIPFYAAVPSPTIDFAMLNGADIQIEERSSDEVAYVQGKATDGSVQTVCVIPDGSKVANPAFDVTPARLVTGVITEKGVFAPDTLLENAQ